MPTRSPAANGARLREPAGLRRAHAGCAHTPGTIRRESGLPVPLTPASAVRREVLPVPRALAPLLPDHGPAGGTMLAYTGTGTLPAAVAEASGHAAAVRLPRPGLLAAAETGARLGRLAVIPDAGRDAAEVAAVLLDRRESAVLALGGATVPAARARPLAAKTRGKEAVLLVTGGSWPLPHPSPKPG